MSDSISLKFPKDPDIYKAVAAYLLKQADAAPETCETCACLSRAAAAGKVATVTQVHDEVIVEVEKSPLTKMGEACGAIEKTDTVAPTEAETVFGNGEQVDITIERGTTTPPPPAEASYVAPPAVELDDDGLPWDSRINTASKLKLKKEGTWKLTRDIETKSPGLVDEVRAELRAAMAASPANPVVPAEVGSTDAPPAVPAPPVGTVVPAPPVETVPLVPAASGETMPFADFMAKVGASGFSPGHVLEAVNRAGLASTVLLATRPDLIQVVHDDLYPA